MVRNETVSRRTALKTAAVGLAGTTAAPTLVGADDEDPNGTASGPTAYVGAWDGTLRAIDAHTGEVVWSVELDGTVYAAPTVADGTVYVGSGDRISSNLYAVDASTGDVEWELTTRETAQSPPTVVDGTVYVGTNAVGRHGYSGHVYAVDAATGDKQWSVIRDAISSSPTVVDDTYVVTTHHKRWSTLRAMGEHQWSFSLRGDDTTWSELSAPTVFDGTVYVGSYQNMNSGERRYTVHALDLETGDVDWEIEVDDLVSAQPLVVYGTIYASLDNSTLLALNEHTRKKVWSADVGGSALTAADETIYVRSGSTLYALDAVLGDVRWTLDDAGSSDTPVTVADDVVYAYAHGGGVCAADAVTGEQLWQQMLPSRTTSPTIVEDPEAGDSKGSRVKLGTNGHTDVWAEWASVENDVCACSSPSPVDQA